MDSGSPESARKWPFGRSLSGDTRQSKSFGLSRESTTTCGPRSRERGAMERYDPRKLPDMPEMMIAGPGELHDEDLDVLGHQVIAHYGDVWTQIHQDCVTALGGLLGAADPPYVMPGIASVGGELCDVDAMGIDCVVTASQKGLEGPPGLGVLALGSGGRERVEARSRRPSSFYLDLER